MANIVRNWNDFVRAVSNARTTRSKEEEEEEKKRNATGSTTTNGNNQSQGNVSNIMRTAGNYARDAATHNATTQRAEAQSMMNQWNSFLNGINNAISQARQNGTIGNNPLSQGNQTQGNQKQGNVSNIMQTAGNYARDAATRNATTQRAETQSMMNQWNSFLNQLNSTANKIKAMQPTQQTTGFNGGISTRSFDLSGDNATDLADRKTAGSEEDNDPIGRIGTGSGQNGAKGAPFNPNGKMVMELPDPETMAQTANGKPTLNDWQRGEKYTATNTGAPENQSSYQNKREEGKRTSTFLSALFSGTLTGEEKKDAIRSTSIGAYMSQFAQTMNTLGQNDILKDLKPWQYSGEQNRKNAEKYANAIDYFTEKINQYGDFSFLTNPEGSMINDIYDAGEDLQEALERKAEWLGYTGIGAADADGNWRQNGGKNGQRPQDYEQRKEYYNQQAFRELYGQDALDIELQKNGGKLSSEYANQMELLWDRVLYTPEDMEFSRAYYQNLQNEALEQAEIYDRYQDTMQRANDAIANMSNPQTGFVPEKENLNAGWGIGTTADKIYSFVNKSTEYSDTIMQAERSGVSDDQVLGNALDGANFMLPDEIERFNAYYNAGNIDGAMQLFEELKPSLKLRQAQWQEGNMQRFADEFPVLAAGTSVATNKMGGIASLVDTVLTLTGAKTGDANSDLLFFERMTNTIRDTLTENAYNDVMKLTENEFLAKFSQTLAQTGFSVADFTTDAAIGSGFAALAGAQTAQEVATIGKWVSLGLMSTESYGATYYEIMHETNGKRPGYAALTAGLNALLELGTETIMGMDDVFNYGDEGIKYWLGAIMGEAAEEIEGAVLEPGLQTIKDKIYGYFTKDGNGMNKWEKDAMEIATNDPQYRYRDANGIEQIDRAGAMKAALRQWGSEILQSGIGGALGGLGGGLVAAPAMHRQERNYGKQIRAVQGITDEVYESGEKKGQVKTNEDYLLGIGEGLAADTKSHQMAAEIRNDLESGKKLSDAKLGRFAAQISADTDNKVRAAIENGLANQVAKKLQSEIGGRHTAAAETRGTADIIAKAVVEGVNSLTKEERAQLTGDPLAFGVYRGFVIDKNAGRHETGAKYQEFAQEASTAAYEEGQAAGGTVMDNIRAMTDETFRQARQVARHAAQMVKVMSGDSGSAARTAVEHRYDKLMEVGDGTGRTAGNATGNRVGEVNAAGETAEIIGVKNGKYTVRIGEETRTVAMDEVKAANPTMAATMSFIELNRQTVSDRFANLLIQGASSGAVTEENVEDYLSGAYKIRIAAFTGRNAPNVRINPKMVEMLYAQSQADAATVDAARTAPGRRINIKPGNGAVKLLGADMNDTESFEAKLQELESDEQRDQVRALGKIFKKIGVGVTFVKEADKNVYGSYNIADGSVIINLAGENASGEQHHLMVTAAHELTHWLESNSKEGYNWLREHVFNQIQAGGGDLNGLIEEKINQYNAQMANLNTAEDGTYEPMTIQGAIAEIVADACDQVLGNETVVKNLARDNQGIYNKIRNFVSDFIDTVKKGFRGAERSGSKYSWMMRDMDELAKRWNVAYEEASAPITRYEGRTGDATAPIVGEAASLAEQEFSFADPNDTTTYDGTDLSTYPSSGLTFKGISTYTNEQQNRIKAYLGAVDSKIVNYFNAIKNNPSSAAKFLTIGNTPTKLSNDIAEKLNIDTTGWKVEILKTIAEHIEKRHGINGRADQSMRDTNDVARAMYVIKNYDSIETGRLTSTSYQQENKTTGKSENAPEIALYMQIDGEYVAALAVPDNKHKALGITSLRTQKKASVAVGGNNASVPYGPTPVPQPASMQRITQTGENSNIQSGQTQKSLADTDAQYMDAVRNGDMDAAREMVEAAAKKNGYTMKVYHGTPYGGFTTFRNWSYFTENKAYADRYNHPGASSIRGRYDQASNPMTYELYMNPGKVFDTRKKSIARLYEKARQEYGMSELDDSGLPDWVDGRDLIDYIEENDLDYDTIILDEGGDGGYGQEAVKRGFSYVTRSNMVKSTDAVTYDDNGEVIPLSERFNSDNNDIRFSLAAPVETNAGGLIAVHNLTTQNLLDTLREGGFTAPSIAVVKKQSGHTKYGPISVVFNPGAIDPRNSTKNKIYGSDAWTPTRQNAQIETELDTDKLFKIGREVGKILKGEGGFAHEATRWINERAYNDTTAETIEDWISKAYNNYGMLAAYAKDTGGNIDRQYREVKENISLRAELVPLYEELLEKVNEAGKTDQFIDAVQNKSINELLNEFAEIVGTLDNEYAKRIYKVYAEKPSIMTKTRVKNVLQQAYDYLQAGRTIKTKTELDFDETGSAMRRQINKADFEKWFTEKFAAVFKKQGVYNGKELYTSSGNRRSFATTHDPVTVENIVRAMYRNHEAKGGEAGGGTGLMAKGSKEYTTLDEVRADTGRLQTIDEEEYRETVEKLDRQITDFTHELAARTGWDARYLQAGLIDAAEQYAKIPARKTLVDYFNRQNKIKLTPEEARTAQDLVETAREIPTGYFEAKPERVVSFSEVNKIILPENAELEKRLEQAGIPYETYDGTEEDRLRKLNAETTVSFSMADMNTGAAEWMRELLGSGSSWAEQEIAQKYRKASDAVAETRSRIQEMRTALQNAEGDEARKLRINLQTEQRKLTRLTDALNRITGSDEWKNQIRRTQRTMDEILSGNSQAEIDERAEQLKKQTEIIRKQAEKAAEKASALGKDRDVALMKSLFNQRELNRAATELRKLTRTSLAVGEIENAMAELALRLLSGDAETTKAMEAFATRIADTTGNEMWAQESLLTNALRGTTFTLTADQWAEMKNAGYDKRTVRSILAGTGIRFTEGDRSVMPIDTIIQDELAYIMPELRELAEMNDKDIAITLIDMLDKERENRSGERPEVTKEEITANMVQIADAICELTPVVAVNDPGVTQLIKNVTGYISEISGNAEKIGTQLDAIVKSAEEAQKQGARVRGAAGAMGQHTAEALSMIRTATRAAAEQTATEGQEALNAEKAAHQADVAALQARIQKAIDYYEAQKQQQQAQRTAEEMEDLRRTLESDAAKRLIQERERWQRAIQADRTKRQLIQERQKTRKQIERVYGRMSRLLTEETDTKAIPEDYKSIARAALKNILWQETNGGKRITERDLNTLERDKRAHDLMDQRSGTDTDLSAIEDEDIRDRISEAIAEIGSGIIDYRNAKGRTIEALTADSAALKRIQNGLNTVYEFIKAQMEADLNGRRILLANLADEVDQEARKREIYGERVGALGEKMNMAERKIYYGNMTPEYFFKQMGNSGMSMIWDAFHKGEDRSGLLTQMFKGKIEGIAGKHGYGEWNQKDKIRLELKSGETVALTPEQMMSLYATYKREMRLNADMQARSPGEEVSHHLRTGGFVLEEDAGKMLYGREAQKKVSHKFAAEDFARLEALMDDRWKAYADEWVQLLSEDGSRLGNDASMRMYGIKKYNESYYFPFSVWDGVKNKASNSGSRLNPTNNNRAAHQGFTNRLKAGSGNAILIRDFTTACVEHINQMVTYSTMAPAIETLNKVLNFRVTESEDGSLYDREKTTQRNLEVVLEERYGKNAVEYIRNMLQDLNGGVTQDRRGSMIEPLMSVFKKNAVGGSLSVALQQPLSYIRAATMISPKYLTAALNPAYYKGSYNEMMAHSGVAVIKDMGRFDMNYGQSAREYLTPEAAKSRGQAVYDLTTEKINSIPEKMDKATWTRMWTACKLETADANPGMDTASDAFLDKVAERFNDVMRKTQVYDSVLVKSSNMRSTAWTARVITAFKAEPTLTANMLMDAWKNRKTAGGKKAMGAALAAYFLSAIAQAAIKGIVGAGRTPDEKKTLAENFMYKFAYNFIGEANPLGLIPGYSEIVDVLSGNEIKDNAYGVVSNIYDTMTKARDVVFSGKSNGVYRDIEDTAGQITQIVSGIPLKNLMRDGRAIYTWFMGSYADRTRTETDGDGNTTTVAPRGTSAAVIKYQTIDTLLQNDLIGAINKMMGDAEYKTGNSAYYSRIYAAEKAGDQQTADEMKEYLQMGKGIDDKGLNSGISSAAKKDESTTAEEKAKFLLDNGYTDKTNYISEQFKKGELTEEEFKKLYKEYFPNKDPNEALLGYEQDKYSKGEIGVAEILAAYKKYSTEDKGKEYMKGKAQKAWREGDVDDKTLLEEYEKYATEADGKEYILGQMKTRWEEGEITDKELTEAYKKYGDANDASEIILKGKYLNGKLNRSEAETIYKKLYPQDDTGKMWCYFNQLDYKKETGETASGDYCRVHDAIQQNKVEAINKAVSDMINKGGKKKSGVASSIESKWKKTYLTMKSGSAEKVKLKDGIIKALKAAGYTASQAENMINKWK